MGDALGTQGADGGAIEGDTARGDRQIARDHVKRRGFARTIGAEEADGFAGIDGEG
ncbi:hypothetical protein D3C86_2247920 [compost metagenome]